MISLNSRMLVGLVAVLLVFAGPAGAQNAEDSSAVKGIAENKGGPDPALDPAIYQDIEKAYQNMTKIREPEVSPDTMDSLFFTKWQHALLQEAKPGLWINRSVDASELNREGAPQNRVKGPRELSLGGILFKATDDWVIYLNDQRMTPVAVPKQVMDIKVNESYIELKWFDSWTNLIYPIRLRPHQRFNLDSRIFLPGSSSL